MNKFSTPALLIAALLSAAPAIADHNSKWGEGIANDPRLRHDTRADAMDLKGRAVSDLMSRPTIDTQPRPDMSFQRMGRPDVITPGAGRGGRH